MIKVGVVGASGRSGARVVEAIGFRAETELHAAVVSGQSKFLNQTVPGTNVTYSGDIGSLAGSDVVIEFSNPEVSTEVALWCAEHGVPLVVATTGHSERELADVRASGARIPLALTPNTSLGAATLVALAESAKRLLGSGFDIELLDLHHRMKKDAPSGTAKAILEPLKGAGEVVFGREGLRSDGEIGVVALRGGDVAGEHTVFFLGNGERIEISHRVSTRAVFGAGAVTLAVLLLNVGPGVYSARDLLERGRGCSDQPENIP